LLLFNIKIILPIGEGIVGKALTVAGFLLVEIELLPVAIIGEAISNNTNNVNIMIFLKISDEF
jgi:hypothetical protein